MRRRVGPRSCSSGILDQLPEIDAGGAFGALARAIGAVELTSNRRQSAGWERAALDELRSGDVAVALRTYDETGHMHVAPSAATARSALVTDWVNSRVAGTDARMYAARRDDVDWLNGLARAELRRRGNLGPDLPGVPGSAGFALGDDVLCLRNDRRIGVMNGTLGKVSAVLDGHLVVETPSGPRKLSASYLEAGFLTHGYASTIHKAQGVTVDRAFVLGTASLYREAGYVAMSRARGATDVYVVGGAFESGLDIGDPGSNGLTGFAALGRRLPGEEARHFRATVEAHRRTSRAASAGRSPHARQRPRRARSLPAPSNTCRWFGRRCPLTWSRRSDRAPDSPTRCPTGSPPPVRSRVTEHVSVSRPTPRSARGLRIRLPARNTSRFWTSSSPTVVDSSESSSSRAATSGSGR